MKSESYVNAKDLVKYDSIVSKGNIQLFDPPKPEGYVEIHSGFRVQVMKMPNRFHCFMMKLIFGWRYVKDEK